MTQPNHGEKAQAKPAQVGPGSHSAMTKGYKIGIRRDGHAVEITLTAGDDYASIELYDSLVQSAKAGSLRLEISIARP